MIALLKGFVILPAGLRISEYISPQCFRNRCRRFSVYLDSMMQKEKQKEKEVEGIRVKGTAHFRSGENEKIKVKVGISPVSTANALANINAEIPHWDFEKISSAATEAWNKELAGLTSVQKMKKYYGHSTPPSIIPWSLLPYSMIIMAITWERTKNLPRCLLHQPDHVFTLGYLSRSASIVYALPN